MNYYLEPTTTRLDFTAIGSTVCWGTLSHDFNCYCGVVLGWFTLTKKLTDPPNSGSHFA